MRITASHALGGYASVMTIALSWVVRAGAASPRGLFATIDPERNNIR